MILFPKKCPWRRTEKVARLRTYCPIRIQNRTDDRTEGFLFLDLNVIRRKHGLNPLKTLKKLQLKVQLSVCIYVCVLVCPTSFLFIIDALILAV